MRVTFLGTSAARPTVERNVSSIAVQREGETLMFDCGEGTQRQMMRYGVAFSLADIFVTHFHADHYLGLVGLIRTLSLQGRVEPMSIWGPPGAQKVLGAVVGLGFERSSFKIDLKELNAGDVVSRDEYDLVCFPAVHGRNAVGYALVEHDRLGRFDPEIAREKGVPEGPMWGKLHRGEDVRLDDGTVVRSAELVGTTRPGRKLVYTGDTRPSEAIVEVATGADLLIHDCTFGDEDKERARETDHSTSVEAAQVALASRARRLVLTHLSARYSVESQILAEEARAVFPETVVARDGMKIEVGFTE